MIQDAGLVVLNNRGCKMKVGLFGTLGIVFTVLKLCNVITWSWWLVLLPFYGGLVLVLLLIIIAAICQ